MTKREPEAMKKLRRQCPECGRLVHLDAIATEPTLAFHFKPDPLAKGEPEECAGSLRATGELR